MKRVTLTPRNDWQQRLEDAGCHYHTIDGKPYWREDAAYEFGFAEIDRIEAATNELHDMCMVHCGDVVKAGNPEGYGFPDEVWALIVQSWKLHEPHLYGRFDLGYDGTNLKMFEYNADTPTALPEASVWQWHALEDRGWPDQFNSIHEKLVNRWRAVASGQALAPISRIHLTAMTDGQHEDWGNIHYLLETAVEAGYDATSIPLEDIGWNEEVKAFRDMNEQDIRLLFKLYPWEWMMADQFGWNVRQSSTRFVEPAWKMLLSTKALLPLLWKKHPNHPLLLEAHFENENTWGKLGGEWIRKPLLGREGANITKVENGAPKWIPDPVRPEYDGRGYVLQRPFVVEPHSIDGRMGGEVVYPVIGSWVVGNKSCGIGIREDSGFITTNASCFVPHYFAE